MAQRIEAPVTYTADTKNDISLSATPHVAQPAIGRWIEAVIKSKGLAYQKMAGFGQFPELGDHIDRRAAAAVGTCALADNCRIQVSMPGAETGSAEDTALSLSCHIEGFAIETDADATEASCYKHHEGALNSVTEFATRVTSDYNVAEATLLEANAALNQASAAL